MCQELQNGATRVWDPEQKVPYIVKGDMWVGYDDPESIREKVYFEFHTVQNIRYNKTRNYLIWFYFLFLNVTWACHFDPVLSTIYMYK